MPADLGGTGAALLTQMAPTASLHMASFGLSDAVLDVLPSIR